jgi:hypothetical protein
MAAPPCPIAINIEKACRQVFIYVPVPLPRDGNLAAGQQYKKHFAPLPL